MSEFITKIKRIRTDELIYALSDISIKMYKNDMCYITTFPLYVQQYGLYRKVNVLLPAWDIPSIEYFSILHSSDHRDHDSIDSLAELINLHRHYESLMSSNQIKSSGSHDVYKIVMGMTSEQFLYQNFYLMFEKLNRTYHILVAARNYEHRSDLDIDSVFKNIFDFTAEDYLAVLLMVFWLCTQHPDPLTAPEQLYRKKDSTIFTKENITKFVKYYSCTYEDLRKSSLQRQLLYSKPFVHTKRCNSYLSSSVYAVGFLLGNGLYWLCRDYYKNDDQKFPNAFGNLFEDYIKELLSTYCNNEEWKIIPQGKQKGADYIFIFNSLQIIVESKSSLLNLDAKQQIPNLKSANNFYKKTIKESYKQLNGSYEIYKDKVKTPTIKVILLYDEFSNTAIIEQGMPEIFQDDRLCFVMTIRQLEILLYLHKNETDKFNLVINKILEATSANGETMNFDAIFDELSIYKNMHIDYRLDYVKPILQHFADNFFTEK
mgnify:CR=1 FL=1